MTDGREPALRRGGGADDGPESSTPRHESRAPPRAAILRRGPGGGGAASCGLREGRVPHSFAAPTRPTTRTAVPVATTSAVAAGCPEGQGGVSYIGVAQSMTGAVTGCVRLGDLPPGPVTIRLDQFLNYAKNDKGPTTRLDWQGRPGRRLSISCSHPRLARREPGSRWSGSPDIRSRQAGADKTFSTCAWTDAGTGWGWHALTDRLVEVIMPPVGGLSGGSWLRSRRD